MAQKANPTRPPAAAREGLLRLPALPLLQRAALGPAARASAPARCQASRSLPALTRPRAMALPRRLLQRLPREWRLRLRQSDVHAAPLLQLANWLMVRALPVPAQAPYTCPSPIYLPTNVSCLRKALIVMSCPCRALCETMAPQAPCFLLCLLRFCPSHLSSLAPPILCTPGLQREPPALFLLLHILLPVCDAASLSASQALYTTLRRPTLCFGIIQDPPCAGPPQKFLLCANPRNSACFDQYLPAVFCISHLALPLLSSHRGVAFHAHGGAAQLNGR